MKNLIYPCLWFNGNAKEAAEFYCSVFPESGITDENNLVVVFESAGQRFMCLNGGPDFAFNPSISFFVLFEQEQEVVDTWNRLLEGGSVLMPLDKYDWSQKYGWVQDKYGINWQLAYGKLKEVGQKFTPTLMFTGVQHGKAEEALRFYTSIFDNSDITGVLKYTAEDDDVEGTVKHAQFSLDGHVFMAMDSSMSHTFTFNEAISLVVECDTQGEIDYFWDQLTAGGMEVQCGWLKDKYGVSWQIVPSILPELLNDAVRSERVVQAFMKMKKFDIEKLINA